MDSKIITLGEKAQPFILALEKGTGLPSWIAETDEIWLRVVADALFKSIKSHLDWCINKKIDKEKDFAATMTIEHFNQLFLVGEAQRFQDYVKNLINFTIMNIPNPSMRIYITFCAGGERNNHVVNAIVEIDKGLILFGAQVL